MAFHITKEFSNGYRCSCCVSYWTDEAWEDELEDALAHLYFSASCDIELTKLEIVDGSTGEKVAWAEQTWSTGYGKYSGVKYTRWKGYRSDTGDFDEIYDRDGKLVEDKSWSEALAGLQKEKAEKDMDEARRELERAQQAYEEAEQTLERTS